MSAYTFTIATPTNPWVIAHGLGDSFPFWVIFDSNGEYILPTSAVATSADVFTFTFVAPIGGAGRILSVADAVSFADSESFADLATVKSVLGIAADDDSQDETISRLIAGVSESMRSYMRREIVETAHAAEIHHGNGKSTLLLKHYPVVAASGVSVSVDGAPLSASDYAVDTAAGLVECQPGIVFPRGVANVSVDYVSGYADGVPQDLNLACVKQVLYELRLQSDRHQISLANSSIAGVVSEAYLTGEWAQGVEPVLRRYQRRSL